MQYDTIIDCPKSGGDLCYKVEVNKEITNYLSLSCGYWTNTLMKEGSEFYEEQLITLPELYKDISWKDPETELIWIPNTINIPELGMVFANGASADEWSWAAVKAVELEEGDEAKVEGQTHKMDMTTMKTFVERDYMEALSYIGVLPE
jgi:hypothetical protein|tara:strand:- start:15 stop:458 length:444 start_codon:yes stop_codon:yes gene_type:complete